MREIVFCEPMEFAMLRSFHASVLTLTDSTAFFLQFSEYNIPRKTRDVERILQV